MTALAKPTRADRLVGRAKRRDVRRSATTRNAAGLLLAKPEVWHCAPYRAWAVKRYDCGIRGVEGHVCGPKVDGKVVKSACHPEPEGKGLKASDNRIVVFCEDAHKEQHRIGWKSFQRRYRFDRDATARAIFESSPWTTKVEVVW